MPKLRVEHKQGKNGASIQVIEEEGVPTWGQDADLLVVGTAPPRLEGREKVTGRARYASDVRLPGLLYARVLRSPHPHARVRRIDISRAEQAPGVHAVICAENVPHIPWYEEGVLFETTVRLVGDEVAAVAAESEELAEDALRLIEVDYEPLPFVTSIEEALRPGAPKVHDAGNIAGEPQIYERGDPEAGLREAEVVINATYETASALHNAFEAHGCTAFWEGDSLTLWDSTQAVFAVREQVAEKLGLPEAHVRVIKHHMGGGFGAKQIAWKHDVIAALLSRQAGRPVHLILDREAENLAVGNRNPTRQHVRLGARRDGTLTAIVARIEQAVGAYRTGGEASNVSGTYQTLYRCPNVRTEQTAVYTNTGPAVAFRAPGHCEGAFAQEQAMDELARALEMDPVALRRKNYSEVDQFTDKPFTLPEGLRLSYDRVTEAFGWGQETRAPSSGRKRRGVGFAAHDWDSGGGHPPGYAWVDLNSDGTADVITGTQDIGTGTRTGLAQVAAEELGLPLDRIAFQLGDTATGPYSPVSSGSATLATIGPAIRAAAAEVKAQLLEVASVVLEIGADRLSVCDGRILVDGDAERSIAVSEVMEKIRPHTLQGRGARGPNPADKTVRTFGAQCVELEVDTETGEIMVLRVVTAHDCGRIVNPTLVDSQVVGGITQGLGYALLEERVVDARLGIVLNANLEEYHVPTVADVPVFEHAHVDVPDSAANSTGAKGIGEPPLVPTAPAVANAVFDAIGIRFREGPLTRQRVLAALAEQGANAGEGAA
ncbi:MAG: aldehyde oxidase and xanthine dehydrogenase molybdopterin binding protein [Thermomicrobiales bacterium]|nr:aldehyde oxidase and xanthine dehydrogenase molybdopterin binding protein [Thermomicrobiales bacterium]